MSDFMCCGSVYVLVRVLKLPPCLVSKDVCTQTVDNFLLRHSILEYRRICDYMKLTTLVFDRSGEELPCIWKVKLIEYGVQEVTLKLTIHPQKDLPRIGIKRATGLGLGTHPA